MQSRGRRNQFVVWRSLEEHAAGRASDPYKRDLVGLSYGSKKISQWRTYFILGTVVSLTVIGITLITQYTLTLIPELPRLREIGNLQIGLTSIVYSADGVELGRHFRQNRTWANEDQIGPHVIEALVATEDHRFYRHSGVDFLRLLSSVYYTLRGQRQGASTITMQLARNLYPEIGNRVTLDRKIKEGITAFKIERKYKKREILEMYLNTVPFGYNTFGIEAAAQLYFNKPALQLDVLESATLIGLLKGTTRYNPVRYPELARTRRNTVLQQMVKFGYLEERFYAGIANEPVYLNFQQKALSTSFAPYFNEYVRQWLEDWSVRSGYDVYEDGLRVYTTLDSRLQVQAQAAVDEQMNALQAVVGYEWSRSNPDVLSRETTAYTQAAARQHFQPFSYLWNTRHDLVRQYVRSTPHYRHLVQNGTDPGTAQVLLMANPIFMDSLRSAKTKLEAGLVAIEPNSGHVLAWVGGRDFNEDKYDKVALAQRQPGSTFKPFVYTAAIDNGYSPYYMLQDSAMTYRIPGTQQYWRPTNSGGGYSGRMVTLRDALALSKNTVTAQLMESLGAFLVGGYAKRMGITSELDYVPSLGLGTSEVTLLEMVSSYGTFATQGTHTPPVVVTRIEDRHGNTIERFSSQPDKVISMYTAYTVLDMMRGTMQAGGTGFRIRQKYGVDVDVAGKTGTTQNNADGWFILIHPHLVSGAWVGFNDRRLTFRTNYWGQGGHNALNVVGDFMQRALQNELINEPNSPFRPPPGYLPYQPIDVVSQDGEYDHAGENMVRRRLNW